MPVVAYVWAGAMVFVGFVVAKAGSSSAGQNGIQAKACLCGGPASFARSFDEPFSV